MTSLNESALRQYEEELNRQANTREFLLTYLGSLRITTSNSIKLQSSTLSQLTQATNQLTRQALVRSGRRERCERLLRFI